MNEYSTLKSVITKDIFKDDYIPETFLSNTISEILDEDDEFYSELLRRYGVETSLYSTPIDETYLCTLSPTEAVDYILKCSVVHGAIASDLLDDRPRMCKMLDDVISKIKLNPNGLAYKLYESHELISKGNVLNQFKM